MIKTVTLETANVTNCHVIATDILFLSSNHRSVQFLYLAASDSHSTDLGFSGEESHSTISLAHYIVWF